MGWLVDINKEKEKKEKIESLIRACKSGKSEAEAWKQENKDKEKEKNTFWF